MCPLISQGLFSILDGMYRFTPLDYVKSGNDLKFVCHYVVTTGAHSVVVLDEVVLLFQYFRCCSRSLRCILGIGPGMRYDSDSTINNRVTHPGRRNILSSAYNQWFRYAKVTFYCPDPTPQEVYETRSRDAFIAKGKALHVTAPPIGLYPRIPRLLGKGYLGWLLPVP